ncbi:MAG: sulfite exporter TauE/SafE, partial [Bradymonadia bacterium]
AGLLPTYSLLGAIAGGFGSLIYQLRMVGLVLAAAVVLGVGLHLFGKFPVPAFIGRFTQPVVTKVAASTRANFALGLSTALLPCGLVYAATGVALASGTPARGALVMAAFGLSTWPALLVFGLGGHKLLKFGPNVQKWTAVLTTVAGLWAVGHRMPAPPETPGDEALPSCCQSNIDAHPED